MLLLEQLVHMPSSMQRSLLALADVKTLHPDIGCFPLHNLHSDDNEEGLSLSLSVEEEAISF